MSISIYKRDTKWRADVIVGKLRKSKVHRTKAEAREWVTATERELLLKTSLNIQSQVKLTVAEALNIYKKEVSPTKKTYKNELNRINALLRNLPNVDWPLDKYSSEQLYEYIRIVTTRPIRPMKPNSVLRDFSLISAFFNWCRLDKRWIAHNPAADVRKPKKTPHRDRRIEVEELEALLAAMGYTPGSVPKTQIQETGLAWLIAIATGMRSAEIINRKPEEILIDQKRVIIPNTKNGTKRIVPLDDFACKLWQLALMINSSNPQRVFNVSNANRDVLFRKARTKAGLDDANLKFHDSRHEAASLLAKRIKNALTLCKVFGWKDPKYALVYYNPTNDEIVDELSQSSGLDALLTRPALGKVS